MPLPVGVEKETVFIVQHFKVAQYPGFLRLTNLEIHADRLFTFIIC